MVHTSEIIICAVLCKLLKSPNVVKKRYHLGHTPLVVCQVYLVSQIQHLLTDPATVVFLEFQVGIEKIVIAVKAGYIIIKPASEFF